MNRRNSEFSPKMYCVFYILCTILFLIHRIFIFGFFWYLLHCVPMFYYFAIFIKSNKIYRNVLITVRPNLVRVQCYQVAFCYRPNKFNTLFRVLFCHSFKVGNKRLFPISNQWIVLNILISDILFYGFARFSFICCSIKCNRILLISF